MSWLPLVPSGARPDRFWRVVDGEASTHYVLRAIASRSVACRGGGVAGPAAEGKAVYTRTACVGCHAIRGVSAGGLGPDNVAEAIRIVRPAGVDSKTKTDIGDTHAKDLEKVRLFVRAAREAVTQ